MSRALIAIGANLPAGDGAPPLESCKAALAALDALPGLRVVAASRWWESAPIPPDPASPRYVNGVALLEGSADPASLLSALQAIENAAGRTRPYPNAPRVLDLDIIDLDGLVRDAPDPVLPHPRTHLRGFVLYPLAEVAPGWVHPRLKQPVAALIAGLPAQDLWPLTPA
ncbi:MAG: 2-amino-4-hydroxy-6-hydroxymethyldihydropteridine diphosphokinase [Roseomonas sp.]|nr:2-amino-4-hydroxy-6-hydroxymethyldihydropteridine diphosphokinase [Roseomonas sp.]MCA3304687.1 2-amino-4-hydroxy-6-hydroxymethyldihydropteridine diphosphokinase [Roseomonas sp.]